jgi:hypothetical protein
MINLSGIYEVYGLARFVKELPVTPTAGFSFYVVHGNRLMDKPIVNQILKARPPLTHPTIATIGPFSLFHTLPSHVNPMH